MTFKLRRPKKLNSDRLSKLCLKFYKLREQLKELSSKDPDLSSMFQAVDKAWTDTGELLTKRKLSEDEQSDAGQVLWTLFLPRDYGWEPSQYITRTPGRRIEQRFSTKNEPHIYSAWRDPWEELAREWKETDLTKVRERAQLLALQWPREQRIAEEA